MNDLSRYWLGAVVAALIAGGVGTAFLFVLQRAPVHPAAPIIATKKPPAVTHAVIGTTVQGRALDAYTYGTGATHLLFVGGMHGGYEWNAAVLAYELKKYLDTHPASVPNDISVTVIPAVNADGIFKVVGKEGPFTEADVPQGVNTVPGRLNAHEVDLNRNFDCHWKKDGVWKNKPVSAGSSAFSEPESKALRDFIMKDRPAAVVFFHSQSGAVYASQCDKGIVPQTLDIMHRYASAAGYKEVKSFDAYPVTGDSEGWLASIGIPALTVELTTHTEVEWDKNLAGIKAIIDYYSK